MRAIVSLVLSVVLLSGGSVCVGADWPHPVVCDGQLYIRHGDVLMALDVKRK